MSNERGYILALLLLGAVVLGAAGPRASFAQDRPDTTAASHVVRPGDTLFSIARRFGVSVDALRSANGLGGDLIRAGQTLRIPPAGSPKPDSVAVQPTEQDTLEPEPPAPPDTSAASPTAGQDSTAVDLGYIELRPGQSLYDLAFATGLSVDSLLALNPEVGTFLPDSGRVVVPSEFATVRYTVRSGDTLFRIARAAGTTVEAIRSANGLQGDVIRVGQTLLVPSSELASRPPDAAELPLAGEGEARVYPERFAGRLMASGRVYDPEAFTISHRDLPIGSIVLVRRPDSGRQTFAEVTDRLPGAAAYLVDASQAVVRALGIPADGNLRVELLVVRFGHE